MQTTNIVIRKRITILFLITIAIFSLLVLRFGWLQLVQGDRLRAAALDIRTSDVPVEAKRGTILDRNGNELVKSVSVDSAYTFPNQIKKEHKREAAEKIAEALGMDQDEIYKKLTQDVGFVWLKRRIDYDSSQKIKAIRVYDQEEEKEYKVAELVEESKRFYRQDNLAAHLLGFVGDDNQGLTGFESVMDEELRGIPGRIVIEKDAAGRSIPEAVHQYISPVPGNNLVLTIDQTIQFFVERELDKIVQSYSPKLAVIIVTNPKTGEILAMGNRPSFNPSDWKDAPQSVWDRNPAIWYNYEPGSTFKIITAASALEEGAVHTGNYFSCPGFIKVADRTIHCWDDSGSHGSQSFAEVCQNSCNPGFINVGLRLGREGFYKYIDAFGLNDKPGINLPGEEMGLQIDKNEVTELNIATMSIGQSIAVTPMQLVCATSAIANGGVLLKPTLLKAVTDQDGKVLQEFKSEPVRQVVSKNTADTLMGLLTDVVQKGTGKNAYVEGYGAAGKTGTAQVVGSSGGYVDGKYVASFMGFAPASDPEIACLVMVAEPNGGSYFGSQVAAPVFKSLAADTLRYLKIPEQIDGQRINPSDKETNVLQQVPDVLNYPAENAERALKSAGFTVQFAGTGELVGNQVPAGGAAVSYNTAVLLELKDFSSDGEVIVPDLKGLTIKETGSLLERLGLIFSPSGSGLAFTQQIPPGTKVSSGTTVLVEFTDNIVRTLRD